MIYINIDNLEPDEDWLNRADALTANLLAANAATRKQIIDDNEDMWGELKKHYCDFLHRKCWYSEAVNDFAHCHLDHFRPKGKAEDEDSNIQDGGYWWLSFNWKNYRYSGPAGNIRKKHYFHVNVNKALTPNDAIENEDIRFLDPCEPSDPEKLKYNNEGIISPKNEDVTSRDYIQAEYTIRRMNLNMYGLVEGRRDNYRKTARIVRETQNLLALQKAKYDMARHQTIKANQKLLLDLANRYSPFSAAVKYCLKESGLEWAVNIAIAA